LIGVAQLSHRANGRIVKTRRQGITAAYNIATTTKSTMTDLSPIPQCPKGVVHPAAAQARFRLERYLPPPELAQFLDFFWIVQWDLRGQPGHMQRTMPFPCVNVAFDAGRSGVFGVPTGAFDYEVKDAGKVLGLRFRAGAFRAFLGRPVSTITDQVLPLSSVFPWDEDGAEGAVLGGEDDMAMISAASGLLSRCLPPPDPEVERIAAILRIVEQSPGMVQVDELAARAATALRTLQKLFSEYVGVSPKWVIRRYRLHEAADRLASGAEVDLADLAAALGYFDQAHFTSDFHKLVGYPPAQYRRLAQAQQRA
jgi:AraC-like DNA-binding protein